MKQHGSTQKGHTSFGYKQFIPYEIDCSTNVSNVRRARFTCGVTDHWAKRYSDHRSASGAKLYVRLKKLTNSACVTEADKWVVLGRIASLLPEADIELQYVGNQPIVSRQFADGSFRPWGVHAFPEGRTRQKHRKRNMHYLTSMDTALVAAKLRVQQELDLLPRGSLSEDSARLHDAEARALKQGVPSTSLVRGVLWDVAHALACRRKAELGTESAIGKAACLRSYRRVASGVRSR